MRFTAVLSNLLVMILDPVHVLLLGLTLFVLVLTSRHCIAHLCFANHLGLSPYHCVHLLNRLCRASDACCSVYFPAQRSILNCPE